MPNPKIVCTCGKEFEPELIGGWYQSSWSGRCPKCNRHWLIEDVDQPEDPEEIMEEVMRRDGK